MPFVPMSGDIARERAFADRVKRERLRDEFATAALRGILSGRDHGSTYTGDDVADTAYRIADAMLAARSRKEEDR